MGFFRLCDRVQLVMGFAAMRAFSWLNEGRIAHGRGLRVAGVPLVRINKDAFLAIGNDVSLLSSNLYYHAQMFGPVKLFADRPGARIVIGDNCRINGACLHAWKSIVLGSNCLIAANVQIIDSNGHALCMENPELRLTTSDEPEPVVLGDNVWVGLNSIILPGTTLGDGCVVAAGSVVKGDFPPGSIVGGVPARVIMARPPAAAA